MYHSLVTRSVANIDWLYLDESMVSTRGKKRHWSSNDQILCKIGMTARSNVNTRLLEWQNTCKHPVINLTPERVHLLCESSQNSKTLTKIFGKLSLNNHKNRPANLKLQTYDNGGFYTDGKGPQTLAGIENTIHRQLWKRYGQGLIWCYGCDPEGHTRHKEWFRVPIKELPLLIRYIDNVCSGKLDSGAP